MPLSNYKCINVKKRRNCVLCLTFTHTCMGHLNYSEYYYCYTILKCFYFIASPSTVSKCKLTYLQNDLALRTVVLRPVQCKLYSVQSNFCAQGTLSPRFCTQLLFMYIHRFCCEITDFF